VQVIRADEKLALFSKPALEVTNQFRLAPDDFLVICAGFEDRSLAVLKNALAVSTDFTIIIIEYLPFIAQNHLAEIRAMCQQARIKTIELCYDRQNPAGFGDVLLGKLARIRGRIFLDISGMSRLLIVQVLVALSTGIEGFKHCVIAYAKATEYPPSTAEVEKALQQSYEDPTYSILLLSSGVFEVTVVPELSSTAIGSGQTRLVAFPTFSADQLTALRAELQPSRYTLIHGIPPSPENQWRPDAIARINRLDALPCEQLKSSTFDYRETLDALLRLYGEYAVRERLLISPTGSKMQAVAIGLFRAFVSDIQIVYPTPKEFRSPDNYTKGVGPLYSLPLEGFSVGSA
jgi:hypothetical protein